MSSDTPTSPARAIGSLVSGSLVATVVGLAVQPILARLYSPEQFGIADLFVAVVTLLYPIGSLRYEDAIVLPKRDDEASALLWLSAGLSVLSAALLLLLPLTAPLWSGSFADVRPFLWGIAPCFLILRLGRILENAAARHKQFGVLARTSVTRSAVTSAGRLGGGLVAPSAGLLIASFGLGFAATLPSLARALRKSTLLQWPRHMARIGRAARKHRRFALFTTPALLLHSATGRLPILLVGTFALASDVGQLGRTFFAIGAPLSLLTRSVSRVFVVEAAELFRDAPDRLGELVRTYLTRMVWAAAGPSAVVLVLGPDLFAWAFGGEWRPAGVYAQWLTPWMVVMACASALTGLFDVTGKQRSDALFSVAHLVGIVGSLLVGAHLGESAGWSEVLGAIAGLGVGGCALRLAHLAVLRGVAPGGPSWTRASLAPLAISAATAAAGLSVQGSMRLVVLILGVLLYLGLAWISLVRKTR